ncbi:MAG: hypothetical protein QF570_12020 [Myxococcota bacterium]|nr:hypothetical protein [Myxococcota bacterium]
MAFGAVDRSSSGTPFPSCRFEFFAALVSLALLVASPSYAGGRPLALGLDLAVQPSFGIFGEDDVGSLAVNEMVDEYTTGIRIGFFATDRHEIQLAIDLSDTEVCAHVPGTGERCRYSDFESYTVN